MLLLIYGGAIYHHIHSEQIDFWWRVEMGKSTHSPCSTVNSMKQTVTKIMKYVLSKNNSKNTAA